MKLFSGWFVLACGGTASAVTIPFADTTDLRTALLQAHGRAQSLYKVFDASSWTEDKVIADDAMPGDSFGFSSAVDGNTALIGAAQGASSPTGTDNGGPGAVYVFANNGGHWTQTQKLVGDDSVDNDQFGTSVAIAGDTAVVGAAFANSKQGAAYVFTRSAGVWTQTAKLVADDGAANDEFGISVAIDGTTVAVGAPVAAIGGTTQGAVYVFDGNGSTWTQTTKLGASGSPQNASVGWFVAIRGATIFAGAPNENLGQGAAYRFDNSAGTWSQTQRLTASDGAMFDSFGWAVAFDGTHFLAAAPFATVGTTSFQGVVYDFQSVDGTFTQTQKVTANDGLVEDVLGICVGLDAGNFVVGAPFFNASAGKAYFFSYTDADGWTQQQEFVASDAIQGEGAAYGVSCATSNANLLIGAALASAAFDPASPTYEGAAYFYNYQPPDRLFADSFESQ